MLRHRDHNYFTYITCNPRKTAFYTGVTNDLELRMQQHYLNTGKPETFAGKYYCHKLLYYEYYSDVNLAIEREKEIKDLSHDKKMELIRSTNPYFRFITVDFSN